MRPLHEVSLTGGLSQGEDEESPPSALERLALYEPELIRLATRLCGSRSDAHDLVQDTFEQAIRATRVTDVRRERSWLAAILHNRFIDQCRERNRQPLHEPFAETCDVENPVGEPEPTWAKVSETDLAIAISLLEPDFRDLYLLRTINGLSYNEIALKTGLPRNTVATRISRARKKLRALLIEKSSG